jgi:hypothetical protein
MKDFSTVLLINILRATVQCLEESPGIDPCHPGTRRFEGALLEEIAKLLGQGEPQMPSLSV